MEIYHELDKVDYQLNAVITVGMFDGIHLGHQALIEKVRQKAQNIDGISTLITFSPHPQIVVQKIAASAIRLLSTIDEKISILQQLGLQRLIIVRFNEEFSRLGSDYFIEQILVKKIGFREIVVGHDHRFGHDKQGGLALLQQKALQYNYKVDLADAVQVDGTRVSSTSLRNLIKKGDISTANKYLGRPYSVNGQIVASKPGEGNVTELTIGNIHLQKLLPSPATYSGNIALGENVYPVIIRVGKETRSSDSNQIYVYVSNPFSGINKSVNIYFQRLLTTDLNVRSHDKLLVSEEI